MLYQQRGLEEKINSKFKELQGLRRLNTMDISYIKFIETKEDPKIKILEKERRFKRKNVLRGKLKRILKKDQN